MSISSRSKVELRRKVPIIYTMSFHGLQLALVCLVELELGYCDPELALSILHYTAFIICALHTHHYRKRKDQFYNEDSTHQQGCNSYSLLKTLPYKKVDYNNVTHAII